MNCAPTGDAGDAVERLQHEQWHILELFDAHARYRLDGEARVYDAARVAALICTLLRVHCELAAMLRRALEREPGSREVLARAGAARDAMLDALGATEALPARAAAQAAQMAALAGRVREWFGIEEREVFALARRCALDLDALDREMMLRQDALFAAGSSAMGLAPPDGYSPARAVSAGCAGRRP